MFVDLDLCIDVDAEGGGRAVCQTGHGPPAGDYTNTNITALCLHIRQRLAIKDNFRTSFLLVSSFLC